jgi:hypothetical protein
MFSLNISVFQRFSQCQESHVRGGNGIACRICGTMGAAKLTSGVFLSVGRAAATSPAAANLPCLTGSLPEIPSFRLPAAWRQFCSFAESYALME